MLLLLLLLLFLFLLLLLLLLLLRITSTSAMIKSLQRLHGGTMTPEVPDAEINDH